MPESDRRFTAPRHPCTDRQVPAGPFHPPHQVLPVTPPPTANTLRRRYAAGWLLTAAGGLAVAAALIAGLPMVPAGIMAWFAAVLLWPDMGGRTRIQAAALLVLGILGMLWGLGQGVAPDLGRAVSANAGLIGLLIGVSFLQLVAMPRGADQEPRPRGRQAFRSTLLGVHLFGAVINLATVFIVGDRIRERGRITPRQTILLIRGFSAAGFWSPFFAAMAAALAFAPRAELGLILAIGLPLAGCALLITWFTAGRCASRQFVGFPVRYDSLRLPGLLAVLVIALHLQYPSISVIALVSLLGPLLTVLILLPRGRSGHQALGRQVSGGLPRMHNELGLFLSAGVLAAGLASVLAATGDWLPFTVFGPLQAWLSFLAMLALALVGVHPVISIAALATVLAPLAPDHSLLAMTFICGWALGIAISPLSGLTLSFQGRYGIDSTRITRLNARYGLLMALACGLGLLGMGVLTGTVGG